MIGCKKGYGEEARRTEWLPALHEFATYEECREVEDDGQRDLGSCRWA